jgi:hypothetical protein
MNEDFKLFIGLMVLIIVFPLTGYGILEWHKQDCRVELVKAGRTVEEIKELCK